MTWHRKGDACGRGDRDAMPIAAFPDGAPSVRRPTTDGPAGPPMVIGELMGRLDQGEILDRFRELERRSQPDRLTGTARYRPWPTTGSSPSSASCCSTPKSPA